LSILRPVEEDPITAWLPRPHTYPHECLSCRAATPERGPYYAFASLDVAVRGGLGEREMGVWVCASCLRHAATRETSPLRDVILRGEAPETETPAIATPDADEPVPNSMAQDIACAVVDEIEHRRKAEHAERMRVARAARKTERGEAA
jgi:hypothetical protein